MNHYGCLFDLDGTLIDSLGDICGHLNHVRRDHGLEPRDPQELRPFIGFGVDYLASKGIPELGESRVDEIVNQFRTYYAANPHVDGELYPGVRETLMTLADGGHPLAIVTNKASLVAEKALEYYLPEVKFEFIHGPDRVSERKPSPKHLSETVEKMGLQPGNCLFVGDHHVDMECAAAAGVHFFGAKYGFGGVESPKSLETFSDLLGLLPWS